MVIHRPAQPKRYAWENLEVGDQLGPVEGVVSDFYVKTHAYAVDDFGDWYLKDSPFCGRIGHPTLLANDILRLFMLGYDMAPPFPGGLHAKNELEFLGPAFVGEKVIIQGSHESRLGVQMVAHRGQNCFQELLEVAARQQPLLHVDIVGIAR